MTVIQNHIKNIGVDTDRKGSGFVEKKWERFIILKGLKTNSSLPPPYQYITVPSLDPSIEK